jgi:hypothetical protein
VHTFPFVAFHRSQAQRLVSAGPSAAKKRVSRVSPDYDNPHRTHAKEGQAERSGQVDRNGEKLFEVLTRLRHNTARPRAEESHVQRPGRAQLKRAVWGIFPYNKNPTRTHAE